MIKVEVQEITNNLDRIRVPLNSMQRAEKETNPIYPYIGANNIMGYIDEYLFDEKILCVAEDGGSWGYQQTCAKIYNEKVWVNNHAHVLTAKDNLILEYLMYYLNYADLTLYINGATRGKLTKSSLNGIKIPLPPIDQQKKIATILDAADAYKQKTKTLITKYDELTQSLYLDMFGDPVRNPKGWEKIAFSNVAINMNSKRIPIKQADREQMQGDYPYYGATGIVDYINDFKFDGEFLLIAEDGKNLVNRKKPIAWTVNGQFWVNNHSHVVKYNGVSNLTFLAFQLNRTNISQYVTGIDQFKMNKSNLDRIPISTPPLTLQNQFAERVQAIEAQKAQAQASLTQAEDLFNSLLQGAFKGELK